MGKTILADHGDHPHGVEFSEGLRFGVEDAGGEIIQPELEFVEDIPEGRGGDSSYGDINKLIGKYLKQAAQNDLLPNNLQNAAPLAPASFWGASNDSFLSWEIGRKVTDVSNGAIREAAREFSEAFPKTRPGNWLALDKEGKEAAVMPLGIKQQKITDAARTLHRKRIGNPESNAVFLAQLAADNPCALSRPAEYISNKIVMTETMMRNLGQPEGSGLKLMAGFPAMFSMPEARFLGRLNDLVETMELVGLPPSDLGDCISGNRDFLPWLSGLDESEFANLNSRLRILTTDGEPQNNAGPMEIDLAATKERFVTFLQAPLDRGNGIITGNPLLTMRPHAFHNRRPPSERDMPATVIDPSQSPWERVSNDIPADLTLHDWFRNRLLRQPPANTGNLTPADCVRKIKIFADTTEKNGLTPDQATRLIGTLEGINLLLLDDEKVRGLAENFNTLYRGYQTHGGPSALDLLEAITKKPYILNNSPLTIINDRATPIYNWLTQQGYPKKPYNEFITKYPGFMTADPKKIICKFLILKTFFEDGLLSAPEQTGLMAETIFGRGEAGLGRAVEDLLARRVWWYERKRLASNPETAPTGLFANSKDTLKKELLAMLGTEQEIEKQIRQEAENIGGRIGYDLLSLEKPIRNARSSSAIPLNRSSARKTQKVRLALA